INLENQTKITHFILMGLTDQQEVQNILFALFLILYLASVLGNGTILYVVMMLSGFLWAHQRISFAGCITQLHFFHFLGSTEALLLAAMAYDRYVAICKPLHYPVIMCRQKCLLLTATTWATGFFHALMHTLMTAQLDFCGPNIIEHFFCDIRPLLRLACSSTELNLRLLNIVTGSIATISFILTLLSYLYIISFLLLKMKSHRGRCKAFSTCSSHLTVVGLLYGPVLFNYLPHSSGNSPRRDMVATLMYSAVTSVLNPLIYTLRNQEMKAALTKSLDTLLASVRV
uniref:Olfactory receptor n=1 Tax=Varanus komodoensis TaxID=61221 RepID=A0A8D2L4P9_VARKO